ncbi:MAG: pitrilysin family protein [bacterium]|nr:pitrilysin family protein [bacterium]
MITKLTVHEKTLTNGLKLIGEINPAAKSVAMGFFVKTGARDETPKEAGISHFLEHMMFKGTESRNTLDITFALGNMAAKSNAYTSEEGTVYYAAVLPEYFGNLKEILCDMLRPSLDPKEFDVEKKVILEEIALYQDRPHYYLFENMSRDYFGNHPAGNSVLGTTQTVGSISRDEMLDYFERRYLPSNMTLVATGNYDWNKFAEDAENYCGKWQTGKVERTFSKFTFNKVEKNYKKKDLSQVHFAMLSEAPSCKEEERYPLGVLSVILGDGSGSKLYWELVDKGLAEAAEVDIDEKEDTGAMMVYAATEPKNLEKVEKILKRILKTPADFTEEELNRAKTKLLTRTVLGGESTMGRMRSLGHEWMSRGKIHDLSEYITSIKAVNRESILNALKKYPLTEWSEFRLLPE